MTAMIAQTAAVLAQSEHDTVRDTSPVLRYPADMGVVDLTQGPYFLDPTGKKDATRAFQRALKDYHKANNYILYLPNGTYRLSNTLDWGDGARMGPQLHGESEAGVTLLLVDKAKGFANPKSPKALINIRNSFSADAFCMSVRNLTIDMGSGNPGAIALQYMTNNQGTVNHVTIRSGDGRGVTALDMSFTDMIGPCLIKHVTIEGFDVGITAGYTVNSMTLEHVTLRHQHRAAIRNGGQCMSLRKITSINTVPAIVNKGANSFMVVLDSDFTSPAVDFAQLQITDAAIQNTGHMLLRNIRTAGYDAPLVSSGDEFVDHHDGYIEQYVSHAPYHLHPSIGRTLNLPIKETPIIPWGDISTWANVVNFGANPQDEEDDTAAIQAAIDSGAATVYFPHPSSTRVSRTPTKQGKQNGRYRIKGRLELRGKVQRLISGGGTWLSLCIEGEKRDEAIVLADGTAPVVEMQGFNVFNSGAAPTLTHTSKRTVVFRHINTLHHHAFYVGKPDAGEVFFEDVSVHYPKGSKDRSGGAPNFSFAPGQRVWARQLNPEKNTGKIYNEGADLWVLGLKTEVKSMVLHQSGKARTEFLGGFNYPTLAGEGEQTAFVIKGGDLVIAMGEAGFHRRFDSLVKETRHDNTKEFKRGDVLGRLGGSLLPLYSARETAGSGVAQPLSSLSLKAHGPYNVKLNWQGDDLRRPGGGEYVVFANDKEIGRTQMTSLFDYPKQDATPIAYRVELHNAHGRRVQAVNGKIITPIDKVAPGILSASYHSYYQELRVLFDKPVTVAGAMAVLKNKAGKALMGDISLKPGKHPDMVIARLDNGFIPASLELSGVRDHARSPNTMSPVTVSVTYPPQPKPILSYAFDALNAGTSLPKGIRDESKWNKGARATLTLIGDSTKSTELNVGVNRFAQVIFGGMPLVAGRHYTVVYSAYGKQSKGASLKSSLLVRKAGAPYTVYASQTIPMDSGTEGTFDFVADKDDKSARLYLIAKGAGDVRISRLDVLETRGK